MPRRPSNAAPRPSFPLHEGVAEVTRTHFDTTQSCLWISCCWISFCAFFFFFFNVRRQISSAVVGSASGLSTEFSLCCFCRMWRWETAWCLTDCCVWPGKHYSSVHCVLWVRLIWFPTRLHVPNEEMSFLICQFVFLCYQLKSEGVVKLLITW